MYNMDFELRNPFYALIQWEKVTFKVDYVFLKEIKKMHCFQGEQDNT